MKDQKSIVSLAMASEGTSFDEVVFFDGKKIRIRHFALNFDYELGKELIQRFDGKCDAFCISGIPPQYQLSSIEFIHPKVKDLLKHIKETPVFDGRYLKSTFLPWSLREFFFKRPELLGRKKISLYSGLTVFPLLEILEEQKNQLIIADPYSYGKIPKFFRSSKSLKRFFKYLLPLLKRRDIKKKTFASFSLSNFRETPFLKEFMESEIFLGTETQLHLIDMEHLKGKTVVVDCLTERLKRKLEAANAERVVSLMQSPVDIPQFTFGILEGLIQSSMPVGETLSENEIIEWVERLNLSAQQIKLSKKEIHNHKKFAFIIHPLSMKDLFRHPLLRNIKPYLKPVEKPLEDLFSHYPGFLYGKINGVKSVKTGKEVEGLIYAVSDTPRKLLEKDPEVIYNKLVGLAEKARTAGCEIIGLGAYTKIVGDAGVTVAKRSPIPVTTGNSLSACSTLWAAQYAIDKMGITEKKGHQYKGTAMIIGATGSIGAVSAKILARSWKKIIIVAPRAYKLIELKKEIKKIAPSCEIKISTRPESYASECDLIITTTSAQGRKIIDIESVKPGCVICDVSRPFDISEEDALKRPDVMVIASGEVELPGDVQINLDMGLEGNAVYACLAETALLAMAGRMESFTLSRNISYKKVLEIDKMSHEHGVRLANIMGHSGLITEDEFRLCREHALKKLNLQKTNQTKRKEDYHEFSTKEV